MGEPKPLGTHLMYPIVITKLLKAKGEKTKKKEPIMQYSYKWEKEYVDEFGPTKPKTMEMTTIVDWDSPAEGEIKDWRIKVGDVIQGNRACVVIEEPCQHPIQFNGLCGVCGKDMTEINYATDRIDTERAPINMTHDQVGLTVSREQATHVEEELQRRLLSQRKLSLVVDLDQTIIHACIDPTVGEWQRDPTSPNYESVKDVQSFQLNDGGPRGTATGCWYYIKMRPGLRQFLENMSKLYELHVYTMGTRAYALSIAKIVDPGQKLFGNRVISRDENGNMTAKSLERLFPVSTNMVLIIDDRADVWPKNRPNLIRVTPYDFFKGVGDINSSFLPRREDFYPAIPIKPVQNGAPKTGAANGTKDVPERPSALDSLAGMANGDETELLKLQTEEQERALEKQLTERPLLHMQEQLDKEDEEAGKNVQEGGEANSELELTTPQRHHLLLDNDTELRYLEQHLTQVHNQYYETYENDPNHNEVPDVGEILDDLKSRVLGGTTVVLSGMVPIGVDVYNSELGILTMSFGAQLLKNITPEVTHLIVSSSRPRTQKVRQAARTPSIKIVNENWLYNSITQWQKLDEAPYLIDVHPGDRGRRPPLAIAARRTSVAAAPSLDFDKEALENGTAEDDLDSGVDDDDEEEQESRNLEEGNQDQELDGQNPRSPIDELKAFDWGEADQEMAEFLASESEDTDGERDSEEDDDEDGENDDDTGVVQPEAECKEAKDEPSTNGARAGTKRKHEDAESESPQSGSLLSKKVRIARERGGSPLKVVDNADAAANEGESLPTPKESVDDEEVLLLEASQESSGKDVPAKAPGNEVDEDEVEADLMAEMEEAFADEKG